jgi:hypothetical protein
MKTRLRLLALALGCGLFSAALASAQLPPPAPVVSIESLTTSGYALGVNLQWEEGTGVLPSTASLEVADATGTDVTSVSFVPQWGAQTVWLPSGLVPLPGDPGGQPLRRNLELVAGSYEEILISTDLLRQSMQAPVLLRDRVIPKKAQKWCYLHLISIECIDPEDSTDDTFITVNGSRIWASTMEPGQVEVIDQWFCLGPSPGMSVPQIVKIFDEDNLSKDDLLGTLKVSSQTPTSGTISRHFYAFGTHYVLDFEIRCFRQQLFPC